MAHYLAELYTPKQAWLDLSEAERQQFFARVGSAMPALSALGVEALSLGKVDQSKLHASKHAFFAVWRCPDDAALEALVSGIAQSGWHDYFDAINAGGEGTDFMGHLVQLGQAA
ncbi:DUF6616 family protein [Rhodopseudomonas pseudopalustris]|uniref:Uncharacterized protein n=1 Tax=Rhodopseudomonas pseudopalustris TaxID=1513892 RepID=A0A1H8T4D5_9BRAD|nr:DUF6616 family protein [Rhodopseudomonas pseudopalustris]SEO85807.1 hypothetical protein SAMN05444123_105219 [Rhodopseudomonas pseudopalustris]